MSGVRADAWRISALVALTYAGRRTRVANPVCGTNLARFVPICVDESDT